MAKLPDGQLCYGWSAETQRDMRSILRIRSETRIDAI